jgi:hypothetical protein
MAELTPDDIKKIANGLAPQEWSNVLGRLKAYYLDKKPPGAPEWPKLVKDHKIDLASPNWPVLLGAIQLGVQDTSPTGACVYRIGATTCCATTTQDVCVNQLLGRYAGDGTPCPGGVEGCS